MENGKQGGPTKSQSETRHPKNRYKLLLPQKL